MNIAHLSAASVSPSLYGSKYFTHLIKPSSELTALIRSPKMKTLVPTPRYSDGVIFSELLAILFTSDIEAVQKAEKVHTYVSLTDILAEYVADYLMGRPELQHRTTGEMLTVKNPISAVELATLVQNKAYELIWLARLNSGCSREGALLGMLGMNWTGCLRLRNQIPRRLSEMVIF
ncbi:hypothetical protein N7463_000095 [Penicillium fimorum]|uniref:Uncharacterized protein n=1 Tax=Penicillium fimorum TaxID=1882269 RepID=A0A9X0CB69_9EURO|nr:hypothetical protein N7463_000095 [Penicillium fimorum]